MEKPREFSTFIGTGVYNARDMDKYIEHIKTEAGNAKLDEIIKMLKKQEARQLRSRMGMNK